MFVHVLFYYFIYAWWHHIYVDDRHKPFYFAINWPYLAGATAVYVKLLQKYENMFEETLGKYTGSDYTIELIEYAKPYHTKPFPIPKIHELTLKKRS